MRELNQPASVQAACVLAMCAVVSADSIVRDLCALHKPILGATLMGIQAGCRARTGEIKETLS
jgi:hypothetical protein